MTEKEREQELFNRIERRQALKMRCALSDSSGSFQVQSVDEISFDISLSDSK